MTNTQQEVESATRMLDKIGDVTADEIVAPAIDWLKGLSDLHLLSEIAVDLFGPVPDLDRAFLIRLTEMSAIIDRAADLIATCSAEWIGGSTSRPDVAAHARGLFEACSGGLVLRSEQPSPTGRPRALPELLCRSC